MQVGDLLPECVMVPNLHLAGLAPAMTRRAAAVLGVTMVLMSACTSGLSTSGSSEKNLVEELLHSRPEWFGSVLENIDYHEVQILYTQIDRDAENRPQFTSHAYRVNPEAYFYPASTVKLAGALLALEKLNRLGVDGLDRDTPLSIGAAYSGQTAVEEDETSPDGKPSIGHYVKKIFLVSDNDAYNRTYELVGQQRLNERLWEMGYKDVRLTHRLSVFLSSDENRHTNPFTFFTGEDVLYEQPAMENPNEYRAAEPIPRGLGYVTNGELVEEPKDFAGSNFMSIEVLQGLLKAALFPESIPAEKRFDLSDDDYRFLWRVMGMLPRESAYPDYDPDEYFDSYVKFAMFGDSKEPMPKRIRVLNKVGQAYGYLTDNAYVVDFDNGVEFLLTAVISVNENRIFNDDNYEYDQIGLPFLANLGRVIYDYELERARPFVTDLSRFDIDYDEIDLGQI
jgi:hypothetical protein